MNKFNDVSCYGEIIHDNLYYCMLKQAYEMYKLFSGPFESFSGTNNDDPSDLKLKMQQFFSKVSNISINFFQLFHV